MPHCLVLFNVCGKSALYAAVSRERATVSSSYDAQCVYEDCLLRLGAGLRQACLRKLSAVLRSMSF